MICEAKPDLGKEARGGWRNRHGHGFPWLNQHGMPGTAVNQADNCVLPCSEAAEDVRTGSGRIPQHASREAC